MKNLGAFINEFPAGFQQNNRFICKVTLPQSLVLTGPMQVAKNWLGRGVICESTNLPDRAFAETGMTQYGFSEQFPYHTQYTALSCVFNTPLNGGDNPVQRVFHMWQNLMQDVSKGYNDSSRDFTFSGTGPKDGYYGTLQIAVFDRQNNPTIGYQFDRVYPRLVDAVSVAWSSSNELAKLPVGFTFSVWSLLSADELRDFFPNEPPTGLTSTPNDPITEIPGGLTIPGADEPPNVALAEQPAVIETPE